MKRHLFSALFWFLAVAWVVAQTPDNYSGITYTTSGHHDRDGNFNQYTDGAGNTLEQAENNQSFLSGADFDLRIQGVIGNYEVHFTEQTDTGVRVNHEVPVQLGPNSAPSTDFTANIVPKLDIGYVAS